MQQLFLSPFSRGLKINVLKWYFQQVQGVSQTNSGPSVTYRHAVLEMLYLCLQFFVQQDVVQKYSAHLRRRYPSLLQSLYISTAYGKGGDSKLFWLHNPTLQYILQNLKKKSYQNRLSYLISVFFLGLLLKYKLFIGLQVILLKINCSYQTLFKKLKCVHMSFINSSEF